MALNLLSQLYTCLNVTSFNPKVQNHYRSRFTQQPAANAAAQRKT